MSDKKQITFTEAVEVKDHNDVVEFKAEVGECVELVETSAARWVNRRKAVYGKLDMDAESGDAKGKAADEGEALKNAAQSLEKAKERYQKAFSAHQKKADDGTKKELALASKHGEKKQQEYDALVAASEKE